MKLKFIRKRNANKVIIKVNDEEIDVNSNITVNPNDDVFIKITQPVGTESSEIDFDGEIIVNP
jgi:hypothetical protein